MRPQTTILLLTCVTLLTTSALASDATTLWYQQPAGKWEEALPLGNGRLGAMVFGHADKERLQLNEESLWAGEPTDAYPDNFAESLEKVQELVLAGKIVEARELGLKTLTKRPTSFRSYEPLADLSIEMEHKGEVKDYRRDLDIETGIAGVSYESGGVRFTREVFISAVDDCIAVRLRVDKPGETERKNPPGPKEGRRFRYRRKRPAQHGRSNRRYRRARGFRRQPRRIGARRTAHAVRGTDACAGGRRQRRSGR